MTLNTQLSPHHYLSDEGLKKLSQDNTRFIEYSIVIASYNYAHL
ncbi:hypothetical protein ALP39_03243 [Pseudomonas marginalis pv. marginalis]|nr:hypothetical protein ALP39_03243 [Pseudomonas marginalis pv. marginalis]VVN39703.1 hypothetical protein PS664_05334 [Pseudomonas fluorescens]VVN61593.1 hypothetical protein PS687_04116 [Pseudomonas fluorescens]